MALKRILVVFAVLAVALAVALPLVIYGGEEPAAPEEKMTAEEIRDAVVEAAGNITTVQYDMDMDMSFSGEMTMPATMSDIVMSGIVDEVNQEMKMSMTLDLPPEQGGPMEMEMYVVADVMYQQIPIPGMPAIWGKLELPEEYWEEASVIGRAIELLESAQAELLGTEGVGGTDCYLLKVEPDVEKLWEKMMQQIAMFGVVEEAMLAMSDLEEFEEMVESFSVKEWVAKDTFFLMKDETQMTMVMGPEAMNLPLGEEEFEVTMDMEVSTEYWNYNQPVSIELPAEAEEAVEMPSPE